MKNASGPHKAGQSRKFRQLRRRKSGMVGKDSQKRLVHRFNSLILLESLVVMVFNFSPFVQGRLPADSRNLTRDAKEKFVFEKRERKLTRGGPSTKPISVAEEKIINALKIPPLSKKCFTGFSQQRETSESRPTKFSIQESSSSDHIYSAEPVSSPIPAQIAALRCQTADEPPSFVESIGIRRLEKLHQTNEDTPVTVHASLPVPAEIPLSTTSTQQSPKARESKRTKKAKKTAEDVYELQCQVLQSELKRNQTQMELFDKQMEFYDMIKKI
ncbi:unnamed protein product [Mytilus coruscus]|uniref:Uncharacterized protein n=1 Tax=Mytilus coruscus TaxID=42192 RepID=A0A6J8AHX1_MYTCO|nr:unnamed protein product [Mytilus coruscus]